MAPPGDDVRFHRLATICEEATNRNTVPGLVVAVGQSGQSVFRQAFGARQTDPTRAPATTDTSYDLASLTKALVTALLTARAVGEGRMRVEDPVVRFLPDFAGPGKDGVTLWHLLAHTSGLPAHVPFFARAMPVPTPTEATRARVLDLATAEPLAYEPGTKSVYSDLGFILLGAALERVYGARLDRLARRHLFDPLGLASLRYRPIGDPTDAGSATNGGSIVPSRAPDVAPNVPNVAPTERCALRGHVVVGEVHDLNAHAMMGVAGHAGLFGAADDVAKLAALLCAAWGASDAGPAPGVLDPATLRRFFARAGVPGSTWRLGWDGPAASNSVAGDRLSRAAVGHLGFTGCSLWIDPARATFVVMLSNRVHPTVRDDPAFRDLRRAVMDASLQAIDYTP